MRTSEEDSQPEGDPNGAREAGDARRWDGVGGSDANGSRVWNLSDGAPLSVSGLSAVGST